jgi:hypothetical protein
MDNVPKVSHVVYTPISIKNIVSYLLVFCVYLDYACTLQKLRSKEEMKNSMYNFYTCLFFTPILLLMILVQKKVAKP